MSAIQGCVFRGGLNLMRSVLLTCSLKLELFKLRSALVDCFSGGHVVVMYHEMRKTVTA